MTTNFYFVGELLMSSINLGNNTKSGIFWFNLNKHIYNNLFLGRFKDNFTWTKIC